MTVRKATQVVFTQVRVENPATSKATVGTPSIISGHRYHLQTWIKTRDLTTASHANICGYNTQILAEDISQTYPMRRDPKTNERAPRSGRDQSTETRASQVRESKFLAAVPLGPRARAVARSSAAI